MPFWRKQSDEEKRREEMQRLSIEELKRGGIPPMARERLERQVAMGRNFFTSDLTAREYLLTRESNFETIGQVMGTAFFNVSYFGMFRGRWRYTGELTELSKAHMEARKTALSRLRQEAKLLGASGVIGVRVQTGSRDWSASLVEFTAIGTAVRIPGWEGTEPFLCDLSGQEFWQLYKAGYKPTGIALGVCSYYMYTDAATQSLLYSWWGSNNPNNQEVVLYTEGFGAAREMAMHRLTQDLYEHLADGVVGMEIDYHVEDIEYEINDRTYHDLIGHFVAMGTSVVKVDPPAGKTLLSPLICVNLTGRTLATKKGSRMQELELLEEEESYDEESAGELEDDIDE